MRIGKRALSLAAALVVGGTLLTLSTGEAEARRRDNGVRCSAQGGWGGDWTFYLPGEQIHIQDGADNVLLRCGQGRRMDVPGTAREGVVPSLVVQTRVTGEPGRLRPGSGGGSGAASPARPTLPRRGRQLRRLGTAS